MVSHIPMYKKMMATNQIETTAGMQPTSPCQFLNMTEPVSKLHSQYLTIHMHLNTR